MRAPAGLRFVRSDGPTPFTCCATGCEAATFTAVESVDGSWDGSAVCENEQHIAEVLANYANYGDDGDDT